MKQNYASPRWSQEILDCSMPMTFDQYSLCSYRCLYCFSFFQKSVGVAKNSYLNEDIRSVPIERVKRIFSEPGYSQFAAYVADRKPMQWGGLADPFDETERREGVGLELIKFFREIKYPISFSTKGVWWADDSRYVDLIRAGKDHFHFKVSIITLDEEKAKKVEVLTPTVAERLDLIRKLSSWGVSVNLRLRPFIIGVSTPSYLDLIRAAADAGAQGVSTEFLCIEDRARSARVRFAKLSDVCGFDIRLAYKRHSPGQSGYLRGSRAFKKPFMMAMKKLCDELGLRFYVSDAHFKELCNNSSCCGLTTSWNYTRGTFTEALLIAKEKGEVRWSDIESHIDFLEGWVWPQSEGFNTGHAEKRAQFWDFSMKDWMRYQWNNVNGAKSPYKYFGAKLIPISRDENDDVVYEYDYDK